MKIRHLLSFLSVVSAVLIAGCGRATTSAATDHRIDDFLSAIRAQGLQPAERLSEEVPGLDDENLLFIFSESEGKLYAPKSSVEKITALKNIHVIDDSSLVYADPQGRGHVAVLAGLDVGTQQGSGPMEGQQIVINGAVCAGSKSAAKACAADGTGSTQTVESNAGVGGYKPRYVRGSGTVTLTYSKVGERQDFRSPNCPSNETPIATFKLLDWVCTP